MLEMCSREILSNTLKELPKFIPDRAGSREIVQNGVENNDL